MRNFPVCGRGTNLVSKLPFRKNEACPVLEVLLAISKGYMYIVRLNAVFCLLGLCLVLVDY
jgi:hypothetical protein